MYFFYSNVKGSKDSSVWLRNCAQFLMSYHDVLQVNFVLSSIFQLNIEAQSGTEYLDKAEELLDNWNSLRHSDLVNKTNRVFRALVFAGCVGATGQQFSSDGMDEMLKATSSSKYKFSSTEDMVFSISQLVVLYCRAGYECFVDKSVRPLFVKNRTVRALMKDFDELMDKYARLPVTDKDTHNELFEESREFLARAATLSRMEPTLIAPMRRMLMDKYTKLLKEYNVSSVRKPPFSCMLYGQPGIGKSYITQQIANFYQKIVTKYGYYDLEFDPFKNVYTYNSSDEYFSGYKGAQQWCMVLDDLGRETQFMIKSGKTEYLNDLFTIVNTVGVATNQAALEDKGVIPLIPKLVIATTNTKDIHAHLGVSEPTALLRRLPYIIEPILKPEYVDPITGIMKQVDHTVHDAWFFKIDTYRIAKDANGILYGTYVRHYPENTTRDLCTSEELYAFLADKIKRHEDASEIMMKGMKQQASFELCEHNVPKCNFCSQCDPLVSQSFSDWIPSWSSPATVLSPAQRCIYKLLEYTHDYYPERYERMAVYFSQWPDGRAAVRMFLLTLLDRNCPGFCQRIRRMSIVFGACAGAYVIHKAISSLFAAFKASGNNLESQANFWSKPELPSFYPPPMHKSNNRQELLTSIKRSLFRLQVEGKEPGKGSTMFCFCISNSRFVTVGHPFQEGEQWNCVADFCLSQDRVTSKQSFVLKREQCVFLENDIMVFESCLLPRKHLLKFLPVDIDVLPREAIIVGLSLDGNLEIGEFQGQRFCTTAYKHHTKMYNSAGIRGKRVDRLSRKGDCGALYLSLIGGGYCITGMHIAGSPVMEECVTTQLSQKLFDNLPVPMLAMSEQGDNMLFAKGTSSSGRLGQASSKGVHHWCDSNGILAGSFAHGVTRKSKIKKTRACDEICRRMSYDLPFGAPVMQPFERDGIWYNPFTLACDVQGNVSPFFNSCDVLHVAHAMVQETTRDISWLEGAENRSLHVAINGEVGNTYINSLPMSTSGGFLYPGPKRRYFEGVPGDYSFNADLYKDYLTMKRIFAADETAGILFNGTLKDEPRKLKKIQSAETRVFTASDAVFSVVVREQYLGVQACIQKYNFISECAVSMDHGTQWQDIYEYVCQFGKDRIIAGDYKNYDKRMPAVFIRAAFYVLDAWRSVVRPLDQESLRISRAIATELSYPFTSLNRDVIRFFGGNSSGHPLTAILNSIANSLFMRFAYWKMGYDPITFKQSVALMTLGDDNIMGSKLDKFNHVTISGVLGGHSVIYTMAQKDAKSVPFINIEEADFLKRSFRMVRGCIMGPIENDSVMRSLCLWEDKGNVSEDKRLADCYLAARREWALHGLHVFTVNTTIMEELFDMPEFSGVRRFFIVRHTYSWETTVDWVKRKFDNEEDDVLLDISDDVLEAQSGFAPLVLEGARRIRLESPLADGRTCGTTGSSCGVAVDPPRCLYHDTLSYILYSNWYPPRRMAYSRMEPLIKKHTNKNKMVVIHQTLFEAQSSTTTPISDQIQHEEAMQQHVSDIVPTPPILNIGESEEVRLDKFFDRKILIGNFTWNVGDTLAIGFSPWDSLILQDAFRRKIHNYNLLKAKLMLTFFINGTPFHQGMVIASYSYLSTVNEITTAVDDTRIITKSQRPHVYLNASTSKSGCLCVPFFFPASYIASSGPIIGREFLGTVSIDSFFALQQLSAGTDSLNISVFAQLVDVVLAGPTVSLFEAQSDEYQHDGPVSGPASAVARMAGLAASVPTIGPYAIATQMIASGVASMAKLFGYSRPAIINPLVRVRNNALGSLALTDDPETVQKLTMTSKAELSIDPRLAEIEPYDTMSLKYLCQKESYLGALTWNPNMAPQTYIGHMQVSPMNQSSTGVGPSGQRIIPTSLSYASRPFKYWSGTIRVRIQVIASQFHRGRFAIIYSPRVSPAGQNDIFNTSYNMIIDLSEGRDFTFDVNWQQPHAYCTVSPSSFPLGSSTPNALFSSNGAIYLRVVNKLAVPDGVTPIRLLFFISAGDDFELVDPNGEGLNTYLFPELFEAQSGFEAQSATEELRKSENEPESSETPLHLTGGVSTDVGSKNLVYYGETFNSYRQLLKRYTFVRRCLLSCANGVGNVNTLTMPLMAMPPEPGFDPNGRDTTVGGNEFTYAGVPYCVYLRRAFAAWKGSIRWKVIPISGIKSMSVERYEPNLRLINTFRRRSEVNINSTTSASIAAKQGLTDNDFTGAGAALTQNNTVDCLEFEVPFYSRWKFARSHKTYVLGTQNDDAQIRPGGNTVMLRFVTDENVDFVAFELYAAAGEDFQLMGSVGAPVYYTYPFPDGAP
jgi:hypothetical protein